MYLAFVATFWSRTKVYNPFVALILALLVAVSLRFFLLVILESRRGSSVILVRLASGALFLVLSWLYFLFVTPLLDWDRPARAVAAIAVAGVLVWVIIRDIKGRITQPLGYVAGLLYLALYIVLLGVATLSLIHTGYIALTGDRVTLVVNVTGETRNETGQWTPPSGKPGAESVTAHHVIIWLPYGQKAADLWMVGDEIAVQGKAIHFSPTLNALGIPQLYSLVSAHNGYLRPQRQNAYPPQTVAFHGNGPLEVHPWWRPIQDRFLSFWAGHLGSNAWYSINVVDNESPYYPLVDKDGKPVRNNFLLVLKTDGIATSRGSSPLEDKH
jgi:hypothetical protein